MKLFKRKKLLVIGPILPQWSDATFMIDALSFLERDYSLTYVDALATFNDNTTTKEFFNEWGTKLTHYLDEYDGFIGFSLGGVIIKQNMEIFSNRKKVLIIFSAPSFADEKLTYRLSDVANRIKQQSIQDGIVCLNHYVQLPNQRHDTAINLINEKLSIARMLKGIEMVLAADSRDVLHQTQVPFLHLIGEKSQLVNRDNVVESQGCQLEEIPNAGMRVLQDNPGLCQKLMQEYLEESLK